MFSYDEIKTTLGESKPSSSCKKILEGSSNLSRKEVLEKNRKRKLSKWMRRLVVVIITIIMLIGGGKFMYRENIESKVEKVAELYDGKARTLDEFLIHAKAVAKGTGEIGIVNSVTISDVVTKRDEMYILNLNVDEIDYKMRKVIAYGSFEKIIFAITSEGVTEEKTEDIAIRYEDGKILDVQGNELDALKDFNFYFECKDALLLEELEKREYSQNPELPWYRISGKLDEKKSKIFFKKNQKYFVERGVPGVDDYKEVMTSLESDSGESILRFSNTISNGGYEIKVIESISTRYSTNHGVEKEDFYTMKKGEL